MITKDYYAYRNQPFLGKLFLALFSTAYFGLFRVGELTAGSHPVLATDVHIAQNKKKVLFILRTSKTHTMGNRPQQIKIASKDRHKYCRSGVSVDEQGFLCPYNILRNYLRVRGPARHLHEPFFVFSDHSPVMPVQFRVCLKTVLEFIGFDATLYNGHSFRIRHCGDLLKYGLSVETIKKLGRWKSNAVFRYLR